MQGIMRRLHLTPLSFSSPWVLFYYFWAIYFLRTFYQTSLTAINYLYLFNNKLLFA